MKGFILQFLLAQLIVFSASINSDHAKLSGEEKTSTNQLDASQEYIDNIHPKIRGKGLPDRSEVKVEENFKNQAIQIIPKKPQQTVSSKDETFTYQLDVSQEDIDNIHRKIKGKNLPGRSEVKVEENYEHNSIQIIPRVNS